MPRFAANLSTMYTEHAFLDRFAAASADGFDAVEYLLPYAFDRVDLAIRLAENGLTQVLFGAPAGDWSAGERGLACIAGRQEEFRCNFVAKALLYAQVLKCRRVHVMAGLVPEGVDLAAAHAVYVDNLTWAAWQAARIGVDVLLEPIGAADMPRYFLNRQAQAHDIVREIGASNLKVQMDLHHCQIGDGSAAITLREYLPTGRVGHLQIAGVPQCHEPDLSDEGYRSLFELIDELGYEGFVGCEHRPRVGISAGPDCFRRHQELTASRRSVG
jgi:hydroxypyruvate isomerase